VEGVVTAQPIRPTSADTIVLIHGLWMTPLSWGKWIHRYTGFGFLVLAPAWPGLEGEIEAIRRDPSPLEGLGVTEIVDHYKRIIRGMDRPPIIIGHSFGGLFVQMLLDRGLGAAGVAIDSAPPKGILRLPLSTIRATWPVLRNPANRKKAVPLTARQFHYAFTNTLTATESRAVHDRYHIPASGRVLFQGAFANVTPNAATRVEFANNDRAPLLLIAGGKDHIIPAGVNKLNARKYRTSSAVTDYVEFPGRSHYIVGQPGWEEVADHALIWATGHALT
jgi:pimeloyl-ACP methyl ester carboxylesterase